jgi:hypothetical protein
MQLWRPGLMTGRLAGAVAIVAVALGGGFEALQLYQTQHLFQANAAYYSKKEDDLRNAIAQGRDLGPNCRYTQETQTILSPARVDEMRELAERYALLKRKYLSASSRPWRPVPPDPPLP